VREGLPHSAGLNSALEAAEEETKEFGHPLVGTEHMILALLRPLQVESVAYQFLSELNMTASKVRPVIESLLWRDSDAPRRGKRRYSPRATSTLEIAEAAALELESEFLGTEHLLLGIVREGGGITRAVFEGCNLNYEEVRARFEREMKRPS